MLPWARAQSHDHTVAKEAGRWSPELGGHMPRYGFLSVGGDGFGGFPVVSAKTLHNFEKQASRMHTYKLLSPKYKFHQ